MNVLEVYRLWQHPVRAPVADHLYSFRRHSERIAALEQPRRDGAAAA